MNLSRTFVFTKKYIKIVNIKNDCNPSSLGVIEKEWGEGGWYSGRDRAENNKIGQHFQLFNFPNNFLSKMKNNIYFIFFLPERTKEGFGVKNKPITWFKVFHSMK